MDWSFVFFLNSILLGAGLAMDAFSVSLANGLNEPKMSRRRSCLIAGTFALFQIIMPLIGWICVETIAEAFTAFQKFIPWIALVLLLFIGGKMLIEGIKNKQENQTDTKLSLWALFVQGIATSIDALSVGFTVDCSLSQWIHPLVEALIIGAVTFAICIAGLILGKKFGTKFAGKASILGGIILIGIGIEIFLKGVL